MSSIQETGLKCNVTSFCFLPKGRASRDWLHVVCGVDVVDSKVRRRIGKRLGKRGLFERRGRYEHGPKIPVRLVAPCTTVRTVQCRGQAWQPHDRYGYGLGRLLIDAPVQRPSITGHPPHSPQAIMSSPPSQSTSRSNFDSIFNSALRAYNKKTGKDIASHPLATELQSCDSPDAILAILRRQVASLDQPANSDERIAKYLVPIVNVLYAFSATLGEGVGLVIIIILSL